jgi:hypothetical protein
MTLSVSIYARYLTQTAFLEAHLFHLPAEQWLWVAKQDQQTPSHTKHFPSGLPHQSILEPIHA